MFAEVKKPIPIHLPQHPATGNGQQQPGKGPYIISGDAFIGRHTPPVWLIDGIIQRSRLYAWTSLTGHGKTAVALYAACMIQAGRKFGHLETYPGNVLYLAGENPFDLEARMLGMCRHYGVPSLSLPFVMPFAFPMGDADAEAICEGVRRMNMSFVLVIGDTAASFFPGDNDNDNVQAGSYARTLRRFTSLPGNPAVIALAHPIKHATSDNLSPRGGGAFLNELDGNLALWSDSVGETTQLRDGGKLRGPPFNPIDFRLRAVATGMTDEKERPEMTIVAVPISEEEAANQAKQLDADAEAVLATLRDNPKWSLADICRHHGWIGDKNQPQKWKVTRLMKLLAADKLVKKAAISGAWKITPAGKKHLDGDDE